MEDRPPYDTGPAAAPELPLTTEDLVALVHAHRQGIPDETGERLLERLPEWLRNLCGHVLTGYASALDVAYWLASLIEAIGGIQPPAPPPAARTENRAGADFLRDRQPGGGAGKSAPDGRVIHRFRGWFAGAPPTPTAARRPP